MNRWGLAVLLGLLGSAAVAAREALKQEIEVKIQAAGVTAYTLEIVPAAEVEDPNMVVGTCENGTKKIVYQRNGT